MSENGNQNGDNNATEKTFTQEELDGIVTERLARQAKKFSDYDSLKAKAAKYDEAQEAGKSEIQKLQETQKSLLDKIAGMEKQKTITETRLKVSKDTGVPVELLNGDDEDTCKTQAENILKFAKGKTYPGVKGQKNQTRKAQKKTTPGEPDVEDFRELAHQLFGEKE